MNFTKYRSLLNIYDKGADFLRVINEVFYIPYRSGQNGVLFPFRIQLHENPIYRESCRLSRQTKHALYSIQLKPRKVERIQLFQFFFLFNPVRISLNTVEQAPKQKMC